MSASPNAVKWGPTSRVGAPTRVYVLVESAGARELSHSQLERLGADLAVMRGLVGEAMTRATEGLLGAELDVIEQVISDDARIDQLAEEREQHTCTMLARQAPVARDLRTAVTALKAAEKIERMGDLAKHVATAARLRYPTPVVPPTLTEQFTEIARCGVAACEHLERAIAAPTGEDFPALARADDRVDAMHREILDAVGRAAPPYPIQVAGDVALLARYYERFADQAVSVAKRLDYIVAGTMPDEPPS